MAAKKSGFVRAKRKSAGTGPHPSAQAYESASANARFKRVGGVKPAKKAKRRPTSATNPGFKMRPADTPAARGRPSSPVPRPATGGVSAGGRPTPAQLQQAGFAPKPRPASTRREGSFNMRPADNPANRGLPTPAQLQQAGFAPKPRPASTRREGSGFNMRPADNPANRGRPTPKSDRSGGIPGGHLGAPSRVTSQIGPRPSARAMQVASSNAAFKRGATTTPPIVAGKPGAKADKTTRPGRPASIDAGGVHTTGARKRGSAVSY